MAFTRYAAFDAEVLDIKGSPVQHRTASLDKLADFENYRTDDGYMYVRIRAISSRVNKNHDGWPSVELAGSPAIFKRHQAGEGFTIEAADGDKEHGFATFVGKPIFVDHNNSNPRRARGVIVDSKFRVLDQKTASGDDYWKSSDVDREHLPAAEVELLLEVDAASYPKYAKAILDGDLDGFSMGANVEYTKCSHCDKVAHEMDDFCSHVLMKGAHHDFRTADGKNISRRSYENCYKVSFFEISGVFDPADETALAREVRSGILREGEARGPVIDPAGDQAYGVKPDPVWDHRDEGIEEEALRLQQEYGYDPEKALEVAQHQHLQQNPLPGASDGPSGGAIAPPYGYTPMPAPIEQSGILSPSAQGMHNDPRWGATKEAENPLPQSFQTRAPDEVDTLRDEQQCPICGSDMDDETCKVCSYVKPPAEFDNPDLTQAQGIRDEMAEKDQQQSEQQEQPMNPLQPQNGPSSGGPLTNRVQPSKGPVAAGVTNDMRWTPQVHPKTAARINKVETPVRTSGQPTSNEPSAATVLSDQTRPVTSAMLTARRLMQAADTTGDHMHTRTADGPTPPGDTSPKTRVDVVGVGGVDQASNEEASKAQTQTDVTGVGGLGVTDVAADKTESLPAASRDGDDAGFNTDKTTEDSGPTKTFGDSDGTQKGVTDPVTSEPFPASEDGVKSSGYEDGTLEQQEQQGDPVAQGGSANQGVQPVDSVATDSYKRVNLLEHQTTPSNNSGPTTTWSGTDGNGVLKQQEPVTQEKMEWGGVPTPDVQLHTTSKIRFINAERLASLEVKLGLTAEDAKPNRMADLMDADPVKVATRLETLEQVKTAGLARIAHSKTASSFPRAFGKQTAASHNFERIASEEPGREAVDDSVLDSALFGR